MIYMSLICQDVDPHPQLWLLLWRGADHQQHHRGLLL
jgi:hypothetical protein